MRSPPHDQFVIAAKTSDSTVRWTALTKLRLLEQAEIAKLQMASHSQKKRVKIDSNVYKHQVVKHMEQCKTSTPQSCMPLWMTNSIKKIFFPRNGSLSADFLAAIVHFNGNTGKTATWYRDLSQTQTHRQTQAYDGIKESFRECEENLCTLSQLVSYSMLDHIDPFSIVCSLSRTHSEEIVSDRDTN